MFTAQNVANTIGKKLDKVLPFTETDFECDGEVEINARVHIQVGHNYLIVGAWVDDETMKHYPERKSIDAVYRDLLNAFREYPV